MAEVNEGAVLESLDQAFGGEPAKVVPAEETDVVADAGVEVEEPEQEAAEEEAPPEVTEPEFEIEVDGQVEVVRGKDSIKELLQKGRDYSRKSEVVARARDALQAQFQQQKQMAEFQSAVFTDVTELRAIESQLEQYNNIDWATAFDSDPFNALKLKEQRDQLRERRQNKVGELNHKQQQFQQGQASAAQAMLAAESAALTAKLPEWRNSDTRTKEQNEIRATLTNHFGFNEAEIEGLADHRMLLVARAAAKFVQLQKGMTEKVKQVREAPPVIKPGAPIDKGKAAEKSFIKDYKTLGRKGQSRAQETLLAQKFERTFK